MHVHRPAALVALGDASSGQVAVEDTDQPGGDVEQRRIVRKSRRQRFTRHPRLAPHRFEAVRQPAPQRRRQIRPQGHVGPTPGLLVGGVQRRVCGLSRLGLKLKLSHCQRRQFTLAKPGQHQRLVDQRALAAGVLKLGDVRGPLGQDFPGAGSGGVDRVDGQRRFRPGPPALAFGLGQLHCIPAVLGQRAKPCDQQQAAQLILAQGPALPTPIGVDVKLGRSRKRARRQPTRFDAPVTEGAQRRQVVVDRPGRQRGFNGKLGLYPPLDGLAVQIAQQLEAAPVHDHAQLVLDIGDVASRHPRLTPLTPLGPQVIQVGGDVIRDRRRLVIEHRILGRAGDARSHLVRPPFKLGQHAPCRVQASAARRHLPHQLRPVAVFCGVGAGLDQQPITAGRRRHLGRALPAVAVGPPGEALALAGEQLCLGGHGLGVRFAVDVAHGPTLSAGAKVAGIRCRSG
ncbi:MAG: hypothetical protein WD009_05505 [Phycisphaeraceae bacterium]